VNTGTEAVENAIKAALLVRRRTAGVKEGGVIVSFEGAFHGRTLGHWLSPTAKRPARFPNFDWPQAIFPTEDPRAPAATQQREERSLRQVWQILQGHGRREAFADELGTRSTRSSPSRELARLSAERGKSRRGNPQARAASRGGNHRTDSRRGRSSDGERAFLQTPSASR
jgi:hypothetical protein